MNRDLQNAAHKDPLIQKLLENQSLHFGGSISTQKDYNKYLY